MNQEQKARFTRLAYFRAIAEELIKEFNPSAVLDIGCAEGLLVHVFRDLGLKAYGVDVSVDAISSSLEIFL